MTDFRYKYGDRPLEGYTIQRAAGRGGFGEVYYAVSDSGRQVALKAIQNYEQIELRGITQCMNLKSPHLVTIFDVKYNEHNEPFVIMEYVAGLSLRDLLKESPSGLGPQKAAFFLREISKGLSYLHDCGIVHRDLKPSNIFYENGYVKIGDYGLTKAISASRHSGHTITVGTVHYMAPEIGAGSYDRSIDIYALGILLYEMLTGQVPFLGSSPAEILMKHMTAAPELDYIEEPFARVIRKAMAKDPAQRYQSVQAMVEDVFGADHVRDSVSQFAPEELSVVAKHIAQKMQGTTEQEAPAKTPSAEKEFSKEVGKKAESLARRFEAISGQVAQKLKTAKQRGHRTGQTVPYVVDSISYHQRSKLALITMLAVALGAGVLAAPADQGFLPTAVTVFVMIGVASKVILRCRRQWWPNLEEDSRWLGKAATCFLAAVLAVLVGTVLGQLIGGAPLAKHGGFPWDPLRFVWLPWRGHHLGQRGGKILALALPLMLLNWWEITDAQRSQRVALGTAVWAGFLGYVGGEIFDFAPVVAACTLAGIALVVQTMSPFGKTVSGIPLTEAAQQKKAGKADGQQAGQAPDAVRPVPTYVRPLWLISWLATVGAGLMGVIIAGTSMRGDDFGITLAFSLDCLVLSLFCFIMMFRRVFAGWYRYLIRPALLMVCVQAIVTASTFMGTLRLDDEKAAVALFFIIFPSVIFLVLLFLPARVFGARDVTQTTPQPAPGDAARLEAVSPCRRLWALLLALLPFVFLPLAGLHRFYVGKIGTGILWLFTFGLFGIGQLIDVILIAVGQFEDKNGLRVAMWWNPSEVKRGVPQAKVAAAAATPAAAQTHEPPQQAQQTPPPRAAEQQAPFYPSTGTVIYEPWQPFSGLLAAIGHIFVFAAILVGLAISLHLPAVVAAGWPDPDLAAELEQLFGYSDWPVLLERLGSTLIVVLLFLAAVFMLMGRRKSGAPHMIRAVVGLGGFFWAIRLFRSEIMATADVQGVVDFLKQDQVGLALERLLGAFSQEEAIFAGVIILLSVLVLAWPPRRQRPVFAPVASQGVS